MVTPGDIYSLNYAVGTSPASFKITVTGCVSYSSEQKAWALTRLSDVLQNTPINALITTGLSVYAAFGK